MGDHQIAARDLLWALGSCCALAGRAFDAQLVLQQVPPPHTLASLVCAARALGLQARLRTLPLARLAGERGPLVLRLRDEAGTSSLGLLVRVDDESITWIPAGSHEPMTQDISSFAPAYGGEVVQLRRPPEPAPDPDRNATAAVGLRWFVPELLKHRTRKLFARFDVPPERHIGGHRLRLLPLPLPIGIFFQRVHWTSGAIISPVPLLAPRTWAGSCTCKTARRSPTAGRGKKEALGVSTGIAALGKRPCTRRLHANQDHGSHHSPN